VDIFLADNADFQGQLKQIGKENYNWKTSSGMGREVQVWEGFEGFIAGGVK